MSFNLATILRESTDERPDAPFLHAGERTLTYREVDESSGRVARSLRDRGLVPGDKVAVQLPNSPEFVTTYFAILKAGLVMVPLNPLFTAREIEHHLADSGSRMLVTSTFSTASALDGAARADVTDVVVVGECPSVGTEAFDRLLEAEIIADLHPAAADDTAVLLYTSGTTRHPKGAELTHFSLFMNCTMAPRHFGMTSEDVTLGVLPLFHVFGLSSVLNTAARFGSSVALLPRFEVEAALDAMHKHNVSVLIGVPTMFTAFLGADLADRAIGSLRAAVSGGASIPGEIIRGFEEKFPSVVILEGYGLSETSSSACFNISADERKVLSIGKPIWGVEMAILDTDGVPLPAGAEHVGEVVVRGHCVMKGYFNQPEATAQTLRDGWLHTGDLGYRDVDGYFFIVDRLKDLIVRGGYNVYPREIEEVLYSHPDIVEAAVIGRSDPRLGEEVEAFVVLRPGSTVDEQALTAHTRQFLAAYKYPRRFHLLPELPKGATGKILKRELRRG
ncbi:long-chain-fatty-acid--CoA ligase [Nocardia fluminea]|uniref:Long-chain acyl-CoA synthetase n=1 Tax=Nocardia fluminea TaxID=134984 RepID=A0A2N3VK37_9NOCA|nr:long-chain fatty acid--CoA ligase [Nocardia fluminea]PKV81968.1 long-chain acyl-CoA synthetase [Nocardia fluminea]